MLSHRKHLIAPTAAAASWTATFGADALNWPDHLWAICLTLAAVTTLPALLGIEVAQRIDAAYRAIWQAVVMKPPAADGDDGPGRVVPIQRGRGGSGHA